MRRAGEAVADIVRKDPAVDSVGFNLGSTTFNNGNFFITLKPQGSRAQGESGRGNHGGCAPARQRRGRQSVPAVGAGHQRRRAPRAHAVPIHADRFRHRAAGRLGAENPRPPAHAARSSPTWCRTSRPSAAARQSHHRPRPRVELRHLADRHRRDDLRRDRAAAGRPVLHAAQRLPRHSRGRRQQLQEDPCLLDKIYVNVADARQAGSGVDVRQGRQHEDQLSVGEPPGTISGDHHLVQPRVRARRSGEAVDAIEGAMRDIGAPGTMSGTIPGHGAGVPDVARDASLT